MNNPEYVKVGDKKYKINTDFRVAIKCNEVAQDESIKDYERALAIIYMLFGDEALENQEDQQKLLELGMRYLMLNKKPSEGSDEKPDMDFSQDMDYIIASFMSDYKIDLINTKMHWWTFYNLLSGLSNSELGNCCILNRIRNLRNMDASQIKDSKQRQKIIDAQKQFALKEKEKVMTKEQEESIEMINQILKLRGE